MQISNIANFIGLCDRKLITKGDVQLSCVANGIRRYTDKVRLRALRVIDEQPDRGGGLRLCRREFHSPRQIKIAHYLYKTKK